MRHDLLRPPSARTSSAVLPNASASACATRVREQQVVVGRQVLAGVQEADQVARHDPRPLVDELVEGVLAVRPRLAPDDRASVVVDRRSGERHMLAVRLHLQLLEVGRQAGEVLEVRQDRVGLGAEGVRVPDRRARAGQEVALEWRRPEVLVHGAESGEELTEALSPMATISDSPTAESTE